MYIVMLIKSYDWGILGEELPTNGIKIRVSVFRKIFRCSNYKMGVLQKWEGWNRQGELEHWANMIIIVLSGM